MRILHTMLRVGDLDKSIDFYVNRLGMNLLRKKDYPHGKFTLAFVGYGSEKENTVIELTYNWDKKSEDYELGASPRLRGEGRGEGQSSTPPPPNFPLPLSPTLSPEGEREQKDKTDAKSAYFGQNGPQSGANLPRTRRRGR